MGGGNLDVAGALNKLAGTSGLEVQGAANAMLDKLVVISDTEPSSPTENQLWYDTTTETLKRYDGTAFQNGSYVEPLKVISYNPGTLSTYTTSSSTLQALDTTNLRATFTPTRSGIVKVTLSAYCKTTATNNYLYWALVTGGTSTDVSDTKSRIASIADDLERRTMEVIVSGLTVGTEVSWDWAQSAHSGSNVETFAGTAVGQALMSVEELPSGVL